MAGVELSTYYVTLAAETSQISSGIAKAFNGSDKMAGKAGKSMGTAMAKGFEQSKPDTESLAKDVEVAQQKVTAAHEQGAKKQSEAARKVEIAQAKLNEARDKYKAGSSQILQAEDRLVASQQKLAAANQASQAQMKKLYTELDNAEQAFGDAQEAAESAAQGTENAFKGVGGRIKSALSGDFKGAFNGVEADASASADDVTQEFSAAGDEAGDGFAQGFAGQLKNLAGIAGVAGIGASLGAGLLEGMEREKLNDKLAAQLNLSGPQAEMAGDIAGSLYSNAYGESLEGVNDAVSATMSSIPGLMKAPQSEIEAMTAKALDLSTAFGVDVAEASTTAGILMKSGLAKDGTEAFDLIVGSMQNVPKALQGEILPLMSEYSGYFGDLGFSGEEAMNLIIAASADGAIGMDKMGDAIKELSIRAVDGSDLTRGAMSQLGLDYESVANDMLAGGERAAGATDKITQALAGVTDPAKQAELAIALFGTPLEDLGTGQIPEFLTQVNSAGEGLVDFKGKAADMGQTLNDNNATGFESLKRTIQTNFVDFFRDDVMPVIDWVASKADVWGPFALGILGVASAIGLWAGAQWLLAAAVNATIWPITLAVAAIGLLIGGVILAYNKIGWFKDFVDTSWTFIKDKIAQFSEWFMAVVWPTISNILQWIGDKFIWLYENAIKPAWDWITIKIGEFVDWFMAEVWPKILDVLNWLGEKFTWLYQNIILPIWTAIRIAIAVVVGVLMTLWQGIVWLLQNVLGPVFMWLYHSVIKPVWDWIKGAINTAWVFIRDNVFNPIKNFLFNTLGPAFSKFYHGTVKPVWNWISDKISAVWKWVKDKALTPMMEWVRDKLPAAFDKGKSAMKKVWDGIKDVFWTPIDWVVNVAIKGLTNNIDKILRKVGLEDKTINFKGITKGPANSYKGKNRGSEYSQGGYTGDGHWLQEAGIVHAGEYVIPKKATQDLMAKAPGFLQSIHHHGAKALAGGQHGAAAGGPGGPGGGLWSGLQSSIYSSGVAHLAGNILGVDMGAVARAWNNMSNVKIKRGNGPNQITGRNGTALGNWGYAWTNGNFEVSPVVPPGMRLPVAIHELGHVLGLAHDTTGKSIMHPMMKGPTWPGAYDRATMQRVYGGAGKGNPPEGGVGQSILDKMMGFLNVGSFLKNIPGSKGIVGDMITGVSTKLIDNLKDWAGGLIPGIGSAAGSAAMKPMLYDNGGWLQPGLSVVNNQTGGPEAVLDRAETANYKSLFEDGSGTVARGNTIINVEREKGEDGYGLGSKIDSRLAWHARK